jgi:hypothetical protein
VITYRCALRPASAAPCTCDSTASGSQRCMLKLQRLAMAAAGAGVCQQCCSSCWCSQTVWCARCGWCSCCLPTADWCGASANRLCVSRAHALLQQRGRLQQCVWVLLLLCVRRVASCTTQVGLHSQHCSVQHLQSRSRQEAV